MGKTISNDNWFLKTHYSSIPTIHHSIPHLMELKNGN
jgi:hypothetical protein